MNYEQFLNIIQSRVLEFLPEQFQEATVSIVQVPKNNGVIEDALNIHCAEDAAISQIYLGKSFASYENGATMDELLQELAEMYLHDRNTEYGNIGNLVMDYDTAKDNILLRIVSKSNNPILLLDTPYKDIENTDLMTIFHINLANQPDASCNICIKQSMLELWGVDIDTVYQQALQNTMEQRPITLSSLAGLLGFGDQDAVATGDVSQFEIRPYEQYVLSNSSGMFGASVILYPNVLQQLSENANANLFILPSSIHELILMQDTGEMSAEELQAMVMGINNDVVEPQEILSNEVYCYDKDTRSLSIATEAEQTADLLQRLQDATDSESISDAVMERV